LSFAVATRLATIAQWPAPPSEPANKRYRQRGGHDDGKGALHGRMVFKPHAEVGRS
jgi:hypothetical protein